MVYCILLVRGSMKKIKYIILALIAFFFVILFALSIDVSDKTNSNEISTQVPRIGQNLWVYNINSRNWRNYVKKDYRLDKNTEIVLQIKQDPQNPNVTSYHLITENPDISTADLFISEGSIEFLLENKLYTYFPRTFEYFEVVFNGFNFVLRRLETSDILGLFSNYQIIKLSDFKNKSLNIHTHPFGSVSMENTD